MTLVKREVQILHEYVQILESSMYPDLITRQDR
jgi:hypothetical protein